MLTATKIGKKVYTNPSVISLLNENLQIGQDPAEIIKRKTRDLAEEMLRQGWSGPPFDPRTLASMRGIRVVESWGLEHDAQLIPKSDRSLEIHLNIIKSETR